MGAQRIRVLEIVGNAEGGGTNVVASIVQHLDPTRYEHLVISPDSPWLADVCVRHHARYLPLPIYSSRFNTKTYHDLAQILTQEQPDIVSAHGTRAAWYVLRALRLSSVTPRVMYNEHLFSFDARRGAMKLPWIALERYICRHADALATGCSANAEIAESRRWIAPERIAMRHYGVELEAFVDQARNRVARADLGIPDDVPLIGTVGRLIPQKGLRYLLHATARVLTDQPSAMLLIVGDGELRADLEAQCHRLGIADHVRFLGADREPWCTLANCEVIAFSSLFEGMQLTCLEALAVGMPVVATRMKGPSEYIQPGRNGLLVPPRNARALADGVLTLLRDPDLRRRFRERAPQAVQEYRIETMVSRFDDAYHSLYASASARATVNGARTIPARKR